MRRGMQSRRGTEDPNQINLLHRRKRLPGLDYSSDFSIALCIEPHSFSTKQGQTMIDSPAGAVMWRRGSLAVRKSTASAGQTEPNC